METKPRKSRKIVYPEVQDNAAMALRVEEGLPVMDVVRFGQEAGFTQEELARMMQIPSRTYARRVSARSRLKLHEGERAARLMRIYDRAKQLFVTDENVRAWLHSRLPALGGRTPVDFARTEPGAREVEAVIDRLEDGVVM